MKTYPTFEWLPRTPFLSSWRLGILALLRILQSSHGPKSLKLTYQKTVGSDVWCKQNHGTLDSIYIYIYICYILHLHCVFVDHTTWLKQPPPWWNVSHRFRTPFPPGKCMSLWSSRKWHNWEQACYTSWWFQPIWNILVKVNLDHLPTLGWTEKCLKPPPSIASLSCWDEELGFVSFHIVKLPWISWKILLYESGDLKSGWLKRSPEPCYTEWNLFQKGGSHEEWKGLPFKRTNE